MSSFNRKKKQSPDDQDRDELLSAQKMKRDIFDYIIKVGGLYFWQKNSLEKVPG